MTESIRFAGRGHSNVKALLAVLAASTVAALAVWLLLLPAPGPLRLTPLDPRPELLDKPHRHLSAPVSAPSARPGVR